MNKFTIQSVSSDARDGVKCTHVRVTMLTKDWQAVKRRKGLGMLYGVDICNELYRNHGVRNALLPTVDDAWRGKGGVKTIYLTFYAETKRERPKLRLVYSAA